MTQKYRLQLEATQSKEFLVIGSSRSMQIGADVMQASVLNLSVSGASIEDYVAILDLARNLPAKTIILGVDPWVFNTNSGQSGWKSLAIEYFQGFDRLTKGRQNASLSQQIEDDNAWRKLVQIFNLESNGVTIVTFWLEEMMQSNLSHFANQMMRQKLILMPSEWMGRESIIWHKEKSLKMRQRSALYSMGFRSLYMLCRHLLQSILKK
ncbi:MAG: hypothetical protein IPP84_14250 [Propionivibrio sp.]|nr:hypothetical protein [Propionivibrio sp.]